LNRPHFGQKPPAGVGVEFSSTVAERGHKPSFAELLLDHPICPQQN